MTKDNSNTAVGFLASGGFTAAPSAPAAFASGPIPSNTTRFLRAVETAIHALDIKPSRFGRDAVGDPRLLFDLRAGRTLRPSTRAKAWAHLQKIQGGAANA